MELWDCEIWVSCVLLGSTEGPNESYEISHQCPSTHTSDLIAPSFSQLLNKTWFRLLLRSAHVVFLLEVLRTSSWSPKSPTVSEQQGWGGMTYITWGKRGSSRFFFTTFITAVPFTVISSSYPLLGFDSSGGVFNVCLCLRKGPLMLWLASNWLCRAAWP